MATDDVMSLAPITDGVLFLLRADALQCKSRAPHWTCSINDG